MSGGSRWTAICSRECARTSKNTRSRIRRAMACQEARSKVGFELGATDNGQTETTMRQARFTRTGKTPNANPGSPAAAGSPDRKTDGSSQCGCGCHRQTTANCGCCKLACFERPKYFCGQLLSDADLTLQ